MYKTNECQSPEALIFFNDIIFIILYRLKKSILHDFSNKILKLFICP